MEKLEFCCQLNPGEEPCGFWTVRAVKARHIFMQNYTSAFHLSHEQQSLDAWMEWNQDCMHQHRYHMRDVGCLLQPEGACLKVFYSSEEWAATSSDRARANLMLSTD